MITVKCSGCGNIFPFLEKLDRCNICGHSFDIGKRHGNVIINRKPCSESKIKQAMQHQGWSREQAIDWLNRREGTI